MSQCIYFEFPSHPWILPPNPPIMTLLHRGIDKISFLLLYELINDRVQLLYHVLFSQVLSW